MAAIPSTAGHLPVRSQAAERMPAVLRVAGLATLAVAAVLVLPLVSLVVAMVGGDTHRG